ncbi:EVE domain-containing protein [Gracilibacillus salinarum]|uniref:EVE domain-containing protein n=1 Tax=Gracilibacillus salinarum TaxID=2932255 RepID=A0ABY4GHA0_9BACI|nr:EVE domain-containing protein [Gracilibacillus salinarum]UOQ83589.1 EVE domain-containing protein [Gracilibacillus salinarum]
MNYWIFQGNPKRFFIDEDRFPDIHNINEYVESGKVIDWSVRQKHHEPEMGVGDKIFIWRSDGGEKGTGGIIAHGEIVKAPYETDSPYPKVDLKIDKARLNEESGIILRHHLKALPEMGNLLIMRLAQLTNYKITEEEYQLLLAYWNSPELLHNKVNKSKLELYLEFYKNNVEHFETDFEYIHKSYQYFSDFRDPSFISSMEWSDFQKIGEHVNAYRMAIARSRALGNMNAPIDKYRESFVYLLHGEDQAPIEKRIDQFLNNPEYKLFGIGINAVSEILGCVFPEKYCFYNQRDRVALENVLEINPDYQRGDSLGVRYIKFQKTIQEHNVANFYLEIIGKQTDLPLLFEVDQFFSFIYENVQGAQGEEDELESEINYWTIAAGENGVLWPKFKEDNQISIGWRELGNLMDYNTENEIKNELKKIYEYEHQPHNDALANYQFAHEIKEGDLVYVKYGTSKILGLARITSPYKYSESNGEHYSYRDVE